MTLAASACCRTQQPPAALHAIGPRKAALLLSPLVVRLIGLAQKSDRWHNLPEELNGLLQ